MTRRTALFTLCAASAIAAVPAQEVWDVVTVMAAALGTGDAGEFLAMCDPGTPGYALLRANVTALVAQADVESGIDPVQNTGDDRARQIVVDWQLQLVDRSALQRVTRRREAVTCALAKRRGKWKVISIEPVAFFAPVSA